MTIVELARLIIILLGKDLKPLYEEPREGDIRHKFSDIKKARRVFRCVPKYSLNDGLKETIEKIEDMKYGK